jgi:hypothetical protein
MANDIQNAVISTTTIKNGSAVVYCSKTGLYKTLDTSVTNSPVIGDIQAKYDNRFYNGTFVTVVGTIDGGGA